MPASTRRDALLRKRLEQFTKMLHGLEKGDVRALHRTRVATRRLRELLPVLQIDGEVAGKLSRRLRKLTARLGSVRELDVLIGLISELHESDRYPSDALARIASGVHKERKIERKQLVSKAPIAELHRLARKLENVAREFDEMQRSNRLKSQAADRSCRWAAEARVARRAAELSGAIDGAGAVYLPERLHVVRIVVKKLRYAMEVASEAGGSIVPADLRALKHEQELLGRLHDRQILIDRARQAQATLTPPTVLAWRGLEALVDSLDLDCRRLHGRYMREREPLMGICGRLAGLAKPMARRVTA